MSNNDVLKSAVEASFKSIDETPIIENSKRAIESQKNTAETISGSIAGQVEGGIQSITSKIDEYSDKVNTVSTEGLLDDGLQSLKGMGTDAVNTVISGFLGSSGSSVKVVFTDPDSNGMVYPLSSSLEASGGASATVSAILQLITGLGVGPGSLQKVVADASPVGLISATKSITGKLGAFDGAEAIATLTENAINSVKIDLENATTGSLANIKDNSGNVLNTLNKTITNIPSSWDSDGIVTSVSSITGVAKNNDSAFNLSMTDLDNSIVDLRGAVTKIQDISANPEGQVSDLTNLSGGKDGTSVKSDLDNGADYYRANFSKSGDEYRSIVKRRVAKDSKRGIIQGISQDTLSDIRSRFAAFNSPFTLSDVVINEVINLSQGDVADFSQAVKLLHDQTGKEYDVVKSFLQTIDTTIHAATRPTLSNIVFAEPYVIGSYQKNWNKGADDPVFPYISSLEELRAEIQNLQREVTEVVVHWTETHTDKNIGSEEVNKYHLAAGLDGIGYHYIIRRDGSLQRGRPINIQGQHSPKNFHDLRSLSIAFVGGINVPSGTLNSENFLSAQSLTRTQFNTFDHVCRAIYGAIPGIQIVGHIDIDDDELDPGFDVISYALSNFGLKSEFKTPLNQQPFTAKELLTNDE